MIILLISIESIFIGFIILGLFRLRFIFGKAPFYAALGLLIYFYFLISKSFSPEFDSGLYISLGSSVLMTGLLFTILLVYIIENALEARKVVMTLIAATVVFSLLQFSLEWLIKFSYIQNRYDLPSSFYQSNLRVLASNLVVLFLDGVIIIYFYEKFHRLKNLLLLRIFFTMAIVLLVNVIVFAIGVAAGNPHFEIIFISSLLTRIIPLLLFSLIVWFYIRFVEKGNVHLDIRRPFKDIFFFLAYNQSYTALFDEKKIAIKAKEDSKAMFELAFKTSPDSVSINRLSDGKYISTNDVFTSITGFTPKDIKDLNPNKIGIWHNTNEMNEFLALLNTNGKVINYEAKFNTKAGAISHGLISAKIIDINGVPHVLSVVRDVTERKKVEKEIKISKAYFQTIFDSTTDAIFIHDGKGEIIDVNSTMCKMYGYENKEEVLRLKFEALSIGKKPYTEKEAISLLKRAKSQSIVSSEWIARHSDGHFFWVEVNIRYVDIVGVNRFLVSVRDIEIQKKAEKEIKQLNRVYEVLSSINKAIVRTSSSKLLLDQICKIIVEKGQFIMAYVGEINPQDSQIKIISSYGETGDYLRYLTANKKSSKQNLGLIERCIATGKLIYSNDIEHDTNIEARTNIALATAYKSSIALPLGIKNHKRNREALIIFSSEKNFFTDKERILLDELSSDISFALDYIEKEKLRKEAENALVEALKKAQESDRLKTAFLHNISHEIRTPMNAIMGFAGLLDNPDISDEEMHYYVSIIKKGGNRMLNTLNDLMTISLLETGNETLNITEYNLVDEVRNIYEFYQPEVTKKGLNFVNQNQEDQQEVIISTDRDKVFAVMSNLIKNAIKYTHEGFIKIGYSITDTGIKFFVEDSGIGVPEERRETIFQRFIQADIEDREAYEGNGLGLSISKSYIEMLGGEIVLKSEVGKGSTFTVFIPTTINATTITSEKTENTAATDKIRLDLTVLIVEDDTVSELYLRAILRSLDCKVLTATNGYEAIEQVRQNPDIDIVLMDLKMPEMDGYKATAEIRKTNKEIIIIAQTAYALSGDREKALAVGCNWYVTKPINQTILIELLQKYSN